MSAERYRKLADEIEEANCCGFHEERCKEAAAILRSLADTMEKGPKPVAYRHRIYYSDPGGEGWWGQWLLTKQPLKSRNDLEVAPLYDSTALLAAEMRGAEHIGRLREELAAAYVKLSGKNRHASDCATSRAPAADPGPCDCKAGEL